jgi:hypothetical protein
MLTGPIKAPLYLTGFIGDVPGYGVLRMMAPGILQTSLNGLNQRFFTAFSASQ